MIARRQIVGLGLVGATISALALRGRAAIAAKEKVLRAVMQHELRVLDPLATSYATRNHGYMIYDTLFAMDEAGQIRPQMVDRYDISEDGLTYRFVLRDGLLFHDHTPVTARDAVASIRRWAQRDTMGLMMMRYVDRLAPLDELTFEIVLTRHFGLLLHALGKPSTNVLFVMPERVALTPAAEQITDYVGSGPFTFDARKWRPGAIAVYKRFDDYRPRTEPPSWGAGGKVVHLDRVEMVFTTDRQSATNALLAGDVDMVEQPPIDQVPILEDDADTVLFDQNPLGYQLSLRFNALWPPFDNPKVRAAALACMNQEDFLKSAVNDPHYYEACPAMFVCGTPLAVPDGGTVLLKSDFERCKRLLREAAYDGTPVVLLHPTDTPILSGLAPLAKQLLERGGFKVQVISLDWQSFVARRAKRDKPSSGGWNAFLASWSSIDVLDPISTAMLNATGDSGYLGWFNDPTLEDMKQRFAEASDPEARLTLAREIQIYALETLVPHVYLGQYKVPMAVHERVRGVLAGAAPYFWNIEKNT